MVKVMVKAPGCFLSRNFLPWEERNPSDKRSEHQLRGYWYLIPIIYDGFYRKIHLNQTSMTLGFHPFIFQGVYTPPPFHGSLPKTSQPDNPEQIRPSMQKIVVKSLLSNLAAMIGASKKDKSS